MVLFKVTRKNERIIVRRKVPNKISWHDLEQSLEEIIEDAVTNQPETEQKKEIFVIRCDSENDAIRIIKKIISDFGAKYNVEDREGVLFFSEA